MTNLGKNKVDTPVWLSLRQGDVVCMPELHVPCEQGKSKRIATPLGVVILSQTCDIIQESKRRCIVAPIIANPTKEQISGAKKGKSPLLLYLNSSDPNDTPKIADMEYSVSIPKKCLENVQILAQYYKDESSREARHIAWRINRLFNRFPFPNEVYPTFRKLRSRAQDKAGTKSNLGMVLDTILEIRVGSDQWPNPHRSLTFYFILPDDCLIEEDEIDSNWEWSSEWVEGLHDNESKENLTLDRVCELILCNLGKNQTTLKRLWDLMEKSLRTEIFSDNNKEEVSSINIQFLLEEDFSYRDFRSTESLDLEVLSNSTEAQPIATT